MNCANSPRIHKTVTFCKEPGQSSENELAKQEVQADIELRLKWVEEERRRRGNGHQERSQESQGSDQEENLAGKASYCLTPFQELEKQRNILSRSLTNAPEIDSKASLLSRRKNSENELAKQEVQADIELRLKWVEEERRRGNGHQERS